jgi:hypothetical protein
MILLDNNYNSMSSINYLVDKDRSTSIEEERIRILIDIAFFEDTKKRLRDLLNKKENGYRGT